MLTKQQAKDNYTSACARHEAARIDYRAGQCSDDEYLAIRQSFFDALEALEQVCPLANG